MILHSTGFEGDAQHERAGRGAVQQHGPNNNNNIIIINNNNNSNNSDNNNNNR